MKTVAIVTRTLKKGKTYEDFRKAWYHTNGFGAQTTMYSVINVFNPKEIITIGIVDTEKEDVEKLLNIDVKERLENPLDDVIEKTIVRQFGLCVAEDDFSPEGLLQYQNPKVNGKEINLKQITNDCELFQKEILKASKKRDQIKR